MNPYLIIWLSGMPAAAIAGTESGDDSGKDQQYIRQQHNERLPDGMQLQWCKVTQGQAGALTSVTNETDLALLSQQTAQLSSTLLVAGEQITLHQVKLPGRGRDALRTIPYQLEPLLLDDVDALEFTLLKQRRDQTDRISVLVCRKSYLSDLKQWLSSADLCVERVIPDYLALPAVMAVMEDTSSVESPIVQSSTDNLEAEQGSAINLNDRILYRTAHAAGVLSSGLVDSRVDDSEQAEAGPEPLASVITIQTNDKDALQWLAESVDRKDKLTLLKAGKPKHHRKAMQRSLWVTVLILICLINIGFQWYVADQLQQQKQRLDTAIETEFRKALPDARKVSPVAQVRQRVTELVAQQQQTSRTDQLYQVLAAFAHSAPPGGLLINRLQYDAVAERLILSVVDSQRLNRSMLGKKLDQLGLQLNTVDDRYTVEPGE